MRVVIIGAGGVATQLGKALKEAKHEILEVYSRTLSSADFLAKALGSTPITNIEDITSNADVYIIAVKDSAIKEILPPLCKGKRKEKVMLHTAGSVPMSIFNGYAKNYGVFYPLQSFSKIREVNFSFVPCFIEANNAISLVEITTLARSISSKVHMVSSEERKKLHLAAVFASNFVNHCYAIASKILEDTKIPFEEMFPLMEETLKKVQEIGPKASQAGPAVRDDKNILNMQLEMLERETFLKNIYEIMSQSIHNFHFKA